MNKPNVKEPAPFTTYQEETRFWETNNLLNLREPGTPAIVSAGGKIAQSEYRLGESLNVRFSGEDLANIRALATKKGVGPTTLVRMWAKEKLQEEKKVAVHP